MHRVGGRIGLLARQYGFLGAQVARVAGEPAARDQDADSRAGAEAVGDRVELDADGPCRGLGRGNQPSVAVADVPGAALGVDLAHPNEQVDVGMVGAVRQLDHRISVDVQIPGEGDAGEGEHVVAQGEAAVVAITPVRGQQRTAGGGRRVGGVVAKRRRCQPRQVGWRRLTQVAAGPQVQRPFRRDGRPVGQVAPAATRDADADPAGPARRQPRRSGERSASPASPERWWPAPC